MIAAPPGPAVRQRAELAGYADLWRVAPPGLARRHGVATARIGDGLCLAVASQAGSPMLNHVIGLGVTAPAGEDDLDRVAAFYAGLGTPFAVAVAGGGLAGRLEARGFAPVQPWMTFHRGPGPAEGPETALRIVDAGPREGRAFGEIVAAAFALPEDFAPWLAAVAGLPRWTCLLAMDGTVPVGAAALVMDGDAAWFGFGATLPAHRGKGAQGALFAERIRRATARGARHLVTETGAPADGETPGPSYRNMLRMGFAEVALRPNYASPEASSTRERSTAS